ALSYSSRWELVQAARTIAADVLDGKLTPQDIDDDVMAAHLATAGMPDPDLLIRTGGDLRISNYLLWQLAYSELYFTDKYWPDFSKDDFVAAIADFQQRERRYGKTSEQVKQEQDDQKE
ncbi:MAG: di-trans,poly-cis-decaprenylcistransferase, partial [Muribaculaceae bacterium]|nr:di-trans,poly-cis-decaprenylcistransferase [Muribaculaceae bacterium]